MVSTAVRARTVRNTPNANRVSIGGSGGRAGGRVAKGIRMAGRMGHDHVTVENLKVLAVDVKAGKIIVSGAVPGSRGTILEVTSVPALKHGRTA